jgi:hypothetical protein
VAKPRPALLHGLGVPPLASQTKLFLLGACVLSGLHLVVMTIVGWPQVPLGIPVATSIVHGIQWGLSGMLLLLVGAILVGPYGGRTLGQNMKLGAHFLYGAFLAHALFDARFGGDPVDPALYSASAALVVWFAATVFDLTVSE